MQPVTSSQFEHLFSSRLDVYMADHDAVPTDQEEQDQLVARLREANKNFVAAKQKVIDAASTARAGVLQDLETGYVKYKEILSNLETARKFYTDLAGHVTRFRNNVREASHQRRQDANELEAELGVDALKMDNPRGLRSQKKAQQAATANVPTQQQPFYVATKPQKMTDFPDALPAPVPDRTAVAGTPPVIYNTASPAQTLQNAATTNATWNPSMGIKFG